MNFSIEKEIIEHSINYLALIISLIVFFVISIPRIKQAKEDNSEETLKVPIYIVAFVTSIIIYFLIDVIK